MDIIVWMREREGDDLAHLEDCLRNGDFVVSQLVHNDLDMFCDCRACTRELQRAMQSPLVKHPDAQELSGKTLVDRADLDEWRKLLEEVAAKLQWHEDEDLAVQCEQTAEFIEGFYLPYDEQGKFIEKVSE